jgi:hypothetical protein
MNKMNIPTTPPRQTIPVAPNAPLRGGRTTSVSNRSNQLGTPPNAPVLSAVRNLFGFE